MKTKLSKRVISVILCCALIMAYLPVFAMAEPVSVTGATVVDPGTADAWENILGTSADGSRYAGRVWVDKSVYADGDTVTLNGKGNSDSTFVVDVDKENGEYFQTVFSALGTSMSTNTTVSGSSPLDVVLVLDTSTSMDDTDSNRVTRMERMIVAANELLEDLTTMGDVRISIVTFNQDSETVIGLDYYNNGVVLSVNNYYYNWSGGTGIVTAKDKNGVELGKDSGYTPGTNLQDGIDRGMNILASAENVAGRAPVAIVLADGRANRAVREDWYSVGSTYRTTSGDAGIMLSTLLNAAYGKTRVEKNYNAKMKVYGIGIDLSSSSNDYIFLNPGATGNNGFNAQNTDSDVQTAWDAFTTWRTGSAVTIQTGSSWNSTSWVFDHEWPASAGVTTAEIAENINYVTNYQDVAAADLGEAFDKIYQELSTNAFNPISTTQNGATGVEDTPLIYVDNLGKYMQIKNIQALQVFGRTFPITQNADGTYSVAAGSGVNPTTNETWNTASAIKINILYNTDGTQQLRVYINQEILPISMDKITVKTENGVTTRTLEETEYPPLRIYYTVGIDDNILLPNGMVNPLKLDADYAHKNADGTVDFYSNAFGKTNTVNADGDAFVDEGDAHVGFIPSHANRFYYYQTQQEIFVDARYKNGATIDENDMYGVLWEEDKFDLTAMTYADLGTLNDTDRVYTYVTFHRPTGNGNEAEQVTYLVYATWGEMKNAATYYDKTNGVFLNNGAAIDPDEAHSVVGAYKQNVSVADDALIAVLGQQSRRVSRLHHMFKTKLENKTGTAELSYAPEYNDGAHSANDIHEHSEVIVWLGNNGKLTLPVASGLQVTKQVTELAEGASNDEAFEIRILLDLEHTTENVDGLIVTDVDGNALDGSQYAISNSGGKILITVRLANGKRAVIMGVPAGTNYTVTEADHDRYNYTYTGATQTVAGKIAEGVVRNVPILPGALYITKEVVHAYGGEVFPTDYEFEFKVTFVGPDGNPIANTRFELVNNYDATLTELTTDASGVMLGKLRHGETVYIKDIPAGTTVTVEEVNVPAKYNVTAPVYRSRNHSGANADADGIVIIDPEQNATVVVTNTYTPDKVGVDISFSGTKIFDATAMPTNAEFTFKLQQYVDGAWPDVEGKSVTFLSGENTSKPFAFTGLHLEFTEPGVYSYQIVEEKGNDAHITYDRSVYTFSVNAVIDSNGDLKAEVVGYNQIENVFAVTGDAANGYNVNTVFSNYYYKTATSIAIEKTIDDLANANKTPAGFVIEVYEATVTDGVWTMGAKRQDTVTDAQGEAILVHNYDNTDFLNNDTDLDNQVTYYFIVKEHNSGVAGWAYDPTEYRVTVVLTKAADETISADFDVVKVDANGQVTDLNATGDNVTITFANTYDPADATIDPNTLVEKELTGRDLQAGEFTFAIFKDGDASFTDTSKALMIGTNNAEGVVSFAYTDFGVAQGLVDQVNNRLKFSAVNKYAFDIVEIKGDLDQKGVTYDPIIYDLVVEVHDENGVLVPSYYFEDAVGTTVTFKNTYSAEPVRITIEGIKILKLNNGTKTIQEGDYTFYLYNEEGTKIAETTNLANGTFKFASMEYGMADIGKTYRYTVKEIAPDGSSDGSYSNGGITWSGQTFTVSVEIRDNGDGTLSAVVTGNGSENIVFVNEYTSRPASVVIPGKKVLENRPLKEKEFNFALYRTDKSFANPTLVNDTISHDAEGNFSVYLGELGEGKHYFLLKEVIPAEHAKGIYYSAAEYHITVVVTDNGTGQMSYTKTVVSANDPSATDTGIVFTNLYSPESGELPVSGNKIYNGGKRLESGMFSVGLYEAGELLQTANVNADGSFVFENLLFDAASVGGTFTYTIQEIIPAGATDNGNGTFTYGNNIYDGSTYTLTVVVADNVKDGVLEFASAYTKGGAAADQVTFTNTFVPDPITHSLQAKKTYIKGLNGNDFAFKLVSIDGKTNVDQTKKNDANGDVLFDAITFEAAGSYQFKITEEKSGFLSFIRPSQAEYVITVTVVNENGVLRVSNMATENIQNTGETNLEFVNTYILDGEDVINLSGTKNLTGDRTQVKANEFQFGLYNAAGELVEAVKNDANGNFQFGSLKFDETDVPINGQKQVTYTIKEIAGDNARYTYDSTVYTVVVTVKDNDEGGVAATYTVNGTANGAITFTNTYTNPNPVTYTPTAKKNYNKTLKGGEFKFQLAGNIAGTPVSQEKTNTADGVITFDPLSFPEAGLYTFTVKEIQKVLGFIQYSAAEYELIVNVIDTKGVLSIDFVTVNNTVGGTIEFTNTYLMDGEGEVTLRGTKKLTGDRTQVKANEFQFGLFDSLGRLVEAVKNDAQGNFVFTTLKFDETDVPVSGQKQITYTIKEIAGDNARYTYDNTVYTVVVTVKDNEQGGVTVTYTVNGSVNGAIAFTNTYANPNPVTYTPMAKKNYNKTLTGGEFKFKLEGSIGGTPVSQEKTNAADGVITFDQLSFPEAGLYTFTVKEIQKILGFIQYSAAEYELVVSVIDTKGVLSIEFVTVNNDANKTIEFTNTYTIDGEDEITLRGNKTLTGGRTTVAANEFQFGLYDAAGKLVEAVKNDADGKFAFTTLKFDETDVPVSGQKQITYTVKEIAGSDIRVTYDQTVYTVVVTVKDNEQGGVTASYTVNGKADTAITFTNVYTPKPADITVVLDVVKTVVNKGSEKIGPDGFGFLLDALAEGMADLTVNSDANGKASFTLTFTEDDIGNTYTYKLTEVNGGKEHVSYSTAEYTITVAISLNEQNELVAVLTKNGENATAIVAEFENVYDYTPAPTEPEYPDSPQTGDNANLPLWFTLLLISAAGIFCSTLYARKKEKEENLNNF